MYCVTANYLSSACQYSNGGTLISQSMVNTTAIFRSEEEVSCPAYRGSLAISNDGVTLSLSVRVVVYDSLCEVCTDTACTQRVRLLKVLCNLELHCYNNANLFIGNYGVIHYDNNVDYQ